ncbi:hypothetical protein [Burkholderia seminalis]|uniref:hypothetical protein n=1 Tax=Burkholderia seminalis TaxID=488731 RepID=UPI000AC71FB7|nr:hypothetical protein [Burkholderia seminalis]MCA8305990.1 hypothetical protein [Burkholderia seminalis]MCA8427283.1 hypothetical protein [Burkholderia seminalis]MCA8434378.1 hypothetical protein [Burkholderia seminalis]MDN7853076.1 hypothetical protein [Burkholderia seminalis]
MSKMTADTAVAATRCAAADFDLTGGREAVPFFLIRFAASNTAANAPARITASVMVIFYLRDV